MLLTISSTSSTTSRSTDFIMKTYRLRSRGDRILTLEKKTGGEHVVTIRLKYSDTKSIELPPKRRVFSLNSLVSLSAFCPLPVLLYLIASVFPYYRWVEFRQYTDDVDKNVRATLDGDQNVKFLHGGAYYTSTSTLVIAASISEGGINLSTRRATSIPPKPASAYVSTNGRLYAAWSTSQIKLIRHSAPHNPATTTTTT